MMGTRAGARHGKAAALTALVLLVLVGLCLAHAADDPELDLCGSVLVVAGAVLASAVLVSIGRCVPPRPLAYCSVPGDRSTPPPRV